VKEVAVASELTATLSKLSSMLPLPLPPPLLLLLLLLFASMPPRVCAST
jgi:hypothetical protein